MKIPQLTVEMVYMSVYKDPHILILTVTCILLFDKKRVKYVSLSQVGISLDIFILTTKYQQCKYSCV